MNALSELSNLPETKDEIIRFSEMAINEICEGNVNALDVDRKLKAIEETIKKIRSNKEVKSMVFDEAEKYGKKFDFKTVNIELTQRRNYDYTTCEDEEWELLDSQIKELSKAKKKREKFLQSLEADMADIESGNIVKAAACIYTDVIKYTFK